jgi:hypothetical protein
MEAACDALRSLPTDAGTFRAPALATMLGCGAPRACKPGGVWIGVALLLAALPLAGCGSFLTEGTADAAGVAGAGVAGAVTKNAVVGAAIGLGVASAADAGLLYVERRVHSAEQDSIAATAGALPVGAVAPWQARHTVPIERNEHGEVVVSRDFGGADFACKEIVFSVETGAGADLRRQFFTAVVCRDGSVWRWATAEPATARWGALQ